MCWLTRILIPLAVVTAAGRECQAAEPDAAELAALIDRHVETRLKAERIPPAEQAVDAEFLRRVYLDLHGVVPTAEQAARFLADPRTDRRARLIDAVPAGRLVGGPGHSRGTACVVVAVETLRSSVIAPAGFRTYARHICVVYFAEW